MFCPHLFLERLPAELRIILGEDDHYDPRPLAEKADQPWALQGGKAGCAALLVFSPISLLLWPPWQGKARGGMKRGCGGVNPWQHSGRSACCCTRHWDSAGGTALDHRTRPGQNGDWIVSLPLDLRREGQDLIRPILCLGKVNAVAPGRLVWIRGQLSNRHFLVYSGAAFSIFSHYSSGGPALAGPAGAPILR